MRLFNLLLLIAIVAAVTFIIVKKNSNKNKLKITFESNAFKTTKKLSAKDEKDIEIINTLLAEMVKTNK